MLLATGLSSLTHCSQAAEPPADDIHFSCTWIKVAKISLGIFGSFTTLKVFFFLEVGWGGWCGGNRAKGLKMRLISDQNMHRRPTRKTSINK